MKQKSEVTLVDQYREQVMAETNTPETQARLIQLVFPKLDINQVRMALLEGLMRGFTIQSFFKKEVYAIPYAVDTLW